MAPIINILQIYILFLSELRPCSKAEVFTAVSECEPLLDTYKSVMDHLGQYIQKEEGRLLTLKRHSDLYKREYDTALKDVPNYLGNPINAFTLIKRLTTDLEKLQRIVNVRNDFLKNITKNNELAMYPSDEDLTGAATAMARLQATYKLKVDELAEGILQGVTYSSPMSAGDCFELGVILYNKGDYKNAIDWLKKAMSKYEIEKSDDYSFTTVNITDYISWAYYTLGDNRNALEWTKKLLDLDPTHSRAIRNLRSFEEKLAENWTDKQQSQTNVTDESYATYEALCRGELEVAPQVAKSLKCFYLTKNHPFLRLAPIKTEQHYKDPDAFVFYDVISDSEIEHIKALAKPKFERAKVFGDNNKDGVHSEYRISKSAFLYDDDILSRVTRRIADFTGLSMDSAELLQVANYGIGGHYVPHYDQFHKSNHQHNDLPFGNRIATVLFYMSEVAKGGATVFPELGVSVFPVKNAALFWLTLHPSGESDLSTLHAGCPVLRGSKWVSNKWIHEVSQEFLRPCTLEYQRQETVRKFPRPVPKSAN